MKARTTFTAAALSVTLLLVSFISIGCGGADGGAEPTTPATPTSVRSIRIETLLVAPTTFEDVIELNGAVEATNDAVLSAQASGTLVYRAPRGAFVARGGVVARVDSTLLSAGYLQVQAQFDVAKAQYALSKDTYDRQAPLYQDSIISATEYERVRAQLAQSEAQLRQSEAAMKQFRKQLDDTRIVAPFGGYVESFQAEVGEQVMMGSPVVRMVNTGSVEITAGVPERYANEIRKGTRVDVWLDQYGGDRFTTEVDFVGSAIDPANRTFPIELRIENGEGNLKPAMSVRLFVTRNTLEDVLVVPQNAILLDESGYGVFVVGQGSGARVAHRREVQLGASYGGYAVITSGVEAGDEVVILGQQNLTEGDVVEVVQQMTSIPPRG